MLNSLVFTSLFSVLFKSENDLRGITNGHATIDSCASLNIIIKKESLNDWRRISHSSSLNNYVINLTFVNILCFEFHNGFNQILPDCAANATIHYLNNNFIFELLEFYELVINAFSTKLVLNYRNFEPMVLLEDSIKKCGFSRPQKPSQNSDWYLLPLLSGFLHQIFVFKRPLFDLLSNFVSFMIFFLLHKFLHPLE